MMKRILSAWVMGTAMLGAMAQDTAGDPVLMTVDGQPVSRSEFEAIYKKNNKDAPVTKEALDEYLDLFINYKLKVRAAEAAGLDTAVKFKTELMGYRQQLARPYLIDRGLNDQLMQEAFARKGEEIRASHILVSLAPDASPEDTLAAWKRIMALRARVAAGEDFAKVAQGPGGSDDPSVKTNGGDLGYFSVLQMVYPFETAAYGTA
ncbi:MAG TPA: peptidylprolyl isomerase, partial [Flavobacteriales bacterium]|nr:peptidylprolyl isomerase [Flavobacteriales bacterium]